MYKTIEYIETGKLAVLKLNRPEKRNAMNREMIHELTLLFDYLKQDKNVVMLQVVGKGEAFCSGADIEWLNEIKHATQEDIELEFRRLSEMLEAFYNIPQIIVTFVHGSVYGGGIGLVACSDFVVSAPETTFSFSEIKLGLLPATISPFVVKKTGIHYAKQLFFTGEKFDEHKAMKVHLVDQVAQPSTNDETIIEKLLKQPHHSLLAVKKLLRGVDNNEITLSNIKKSSALISGLLKTKETQNLLDKFLNAKG